MCKTAWFPVDLLQEERMGRCQQRGGSGIEYMHADAAPSSFKSSSLACSAAAIVACNPSAQQVQHPPRFGNRLLTLMSGVRAAFLGQPKKGPFLSNTMFAERGVDKTLDTPHTQEPARPPAPSRAPFPLSTLRPTPPYPDPSSPTPTPPPHPLPHRFPSTSV